ncbi:HNH endonuclease signature motif containing protein [Glycomyces artemisiae]|uniref:HNH endonuclease n=1 Tax=Glycomyces artemisiae TaxID=1076443 RepID=A0A2T0URH8_9ACTN|nr:HNH endonuclease signature motif containing protein [Glycomyces artemisiae]PRY60514.1 HNH endonuclease [Glycomyces artemisiae]
MSANRSPSTKAQSVRACLDDTAALINGAYATALRVAIDAFAHQVHRDGDGFSAQRDWMIAQFDFTHSAAGDIAAIAKHAPRFTVLAEAALSGYARIDQVAYAVRSLAKTAASALFARIPFRTPVASPFDPNTACATPEALVAEYAAHAPFKVLKRHLAELHANLAEEAELLDGLGEESLQRLELQELGEGGMWVLSGLLSADTGRLMDKYLNTAVPPPRQDETDQHGVLPPQANRNAEALHQLLAGYGASPDAVKRHGHTATLDLMVDIETLQGKDTDRAALLEGQPVSVAKARLLACEAGVIPSVFDYATGEAVELGRAARLPNTSLRRKLELEQPEGCAWTGCDRPVAWTEAHHLVHWADGGETNADNLILLCRFHHGRIHTAGWTVEKTGPGRAVITHHDHPAASGTAVLAGAAGNGEAEGCECLDWRTDVDMDASVADDAKYLFPTGLYPFEWSSALASDLGSMAAQVQAAREYFEGGSAARFDARGLGSGLGREEGRTPTESEVCRVPVTDPPRVFGEGRSAEDLIPFLPRLPGPRTPAGTRTQHAGPEWPPPPRQLHVPAPDPGCGHSHCPPVEAIETPCATADARPVHGQAVTPPGRSAAGSLDRLAAPSPVRAAPQPRAALPSAEPTARGPAGSRRGRPARPPDSSRACSSATLEPRADRIPRPPRGTAPDRIPRPPRGTAQRHRPEGRASPSRRQSAACTRAERAAVFAGAEDGEFDVADQQGPA